MENKEENRNKIRVGLGVMIFRDGKILFGKRKSSHGVGEWALPGGHLEYMESFEDCIRRETREECGIEIKNIKFQFLGNVQDYAPKHYVQIGFIADWESGEEKTLEPDKIGEWKWFSLSDLPEPIFSASKLPIEAFLKGQNYRDAK